VAGIGRRWRRRRFFGQALRGRVYLKAGRVYMADDRLTALILAQYTGADRSQVYPRLVRFRLLLSGAG
jgi:hypothetical protein